VSSRKKIQLDPGIKITEITGFGLSCKYGSGSSLGQPLGVKSVGFIEVASSAGVTGIGETYAGVYAPELVAPIVDFLRRLIIGKPVCEVSEISETLRHIPFIGRNGLIRSIASAIDIALWDLAGKLLEKPVYALFAENPRSDMPVYASGGSAAVDAATIKSELDGLIDEGHKAFKMRVGYQSWASDLKRVAAARKRLGPERDLMVDAIMGTLTPPWTSETAIARAQDLEDFSLRWLEEPVHPDDLSGLAETRRLSPVPIAAGEAYSGEGEYEELLAREAVDILQFDATHSGGIEACLKLSEQATEQNLGSAIHVWGSAVALAANIHLAFAAPKIDILEIPMVPLEISQHMWIDAPQIHGGILSAPSAPGLGVHIPPDLKERYKLVPDSGYRL
jgi:L-alanine-DL-glutamate epimerase-like enolase superfamily enzyme